MKSRCLWLALLLGAAATSASAMIEHKVQKTFSVAAAGAVLDAGLFSGAINVTVSDGNAIEVELVEQCEEKTEAAAAPKFANLDLAIGQQADGRVAITATYRQKVSFTWQNWPPVLLTLNVKVPRHCDVTLQTRDGDITVGALQGKVDLRNETGKIFADEIDGTLTVHSRSGEIGLTACSGMIEVQTLTAPILIGRSPGGARLASDGGAIEIQNAGGVTTVTGNGSEVKVHFAHPVTHMADLTTSGGNIMVVFDQRSAANLDAQASIFGKVMVQNLPLPGLTNGEKRVGLSAKLNGGGPAIVIRAAGGHVILRGEKPPEEFKPDPVPAPEGAKLPADDRIKPPGGGAAP